MRKTLSMVGVLLASLAASAHAESSATLRGSRDSMIRQHQVAQSQDFTFLGTPTQVETYVEAGRLVPVEGNENFRLSNVSYPYARPALRTFVERLGAEYRAACGEKLVVTSLTRPRSLQPSNAHELSVHPTGMAVDLRISEVTSCREWLEGTLLSLEKQELLDITRERTPPHYHVAVFPEAYLAHVERVIADSARSAQAEAAEEARVAERAAAVLAASGSTLRPATASRTDAGESGRRDRPWLVFGVLAAAGAAVLRRRSQARVSESDRS